ncbi:MAG: family 16 glycosylhydrolase [Bacteroidales bacterium]
MKQFIIAYLLIVLNGSVLGQICHPQLILADSDGVCNVNPYMIVFEDEFEGDSLDNTKWQIQPWAQGSLTGDNSQQYYSLDNVVLSAGICNIIAKKDTVLRKAVSWLPDDEIMADGLPNLRTYYFTSSNIWTLDQFGYGIYEIRCKIPYGKGFWPAFWVYGRDSTVNREIDVFEFWDDNTSTHHMTAHYNGKMCESDYNGPDFSLDFHTFKVIWDEYKLEWYVDDVLKRRMTKFNTLFGQNVSCDEVGANNLYLLEKSFPADSVNIITNVAIQTGTFAPDSNTLFPDTLEIDYIRYSRQIPVTGIETVLNPANQGNDTFMIKVFPNPNSGYLTLEVDAGRRLNYEVCLIDTQGITVFKSEGVTEKLIHLDISRLQRGVYLLKILNPLTRQEAIRKIIFN